MVMRNPIIALLLLAVAAGAWPKHSGARAAKRRTPAATCCTCTCKPVRGVTSARWPLGY